MPDPPTPRPGAAATSSPHPHPHPPHPPQPLPPPPPPHLPVITKDELLSELQRLLAARRIAPPSPPPASSPTYGQRTTVRREAFDAVQRWIDRPQGSHINFHAAESSALRWLPWHVYGRMRRELGPSNVVAVFHHGAPLSSSSSCSSSTTEREQEGAQREREREEDGEEARTIAYLGVLVLQMVRALPPGACEKGALIRRDARGLLVLGTGTGTMGARDRYERGLKAVMWLTLQLGPGAAFFLDGGTESIDRETADRLVGVLLSPETRNKLWLHFCREKSGSSSSSSSKGAKGKGKKRRGGGGGGGGGNGGSGGDAHHRSSSPQPPSSYQEIVLESRQFTVRSCQFSLAPPPPPQAAQGAAGCRRISELSVRMPPKEPHPVLFTKVEGGGKGNLAQKFRDLKQLFQ
ncbi:hypothetical protein F4809DRAFT_642349 [Biscogniauxia mediterranea]|nr:hypothetical protein F4809DRAFT_642349 [Biscogniauxia mediterranea]